ncbi:MAG: hypothetical protein A2287_05905 [Candidatus Melainabacteria bacterium RIFOXYA12_FULL_32_12]|nr:MAG: hypothetical protein A2255_03070 [Candidatus Melainabacteria bacterium RIFOXYA2_FULL_32_9]OGI30883.1 MAG: hypothetical protein A2287_05905 [Candidatus Melainabacteria bacterium RIFOXYA12_FULL_32_12]
MLSSIDPNKANFIYASKEVINPANVCRIYRNPEFGNSPATTLDRSIIEFTNGSKIGYSESVQTLRESLNLIG